MWQYVPSVDSDDGIEHVLETEYVPIILGKEEALI
jgi:hypothetical protein